MEDQSPRKMRKKSLRRLCPLLRPGPSASCQHPLAPHLQLPPTSLCLCPGPGCPGLTVAPWLLEVLSRTLLKSCPEHRPLWLQLTPLSSKDHRAAASVARWPFSMFPGRPLVLTSLLPPSRKIWGRKGNGHAMPAPHLPRGCPGETHLLKPSFWEEGSRGTGPDSIFYGVARPWQVTRPLSLVC